MCISTTMKLHITVLICALRTLKVNVQLFSLPAEIFVTSQIILNPYGNFDSPLSVVIIVICDSNGSVGVLTQFSQLLCCQAPLQRIVHFHHLLSSPGLIIYSLLSSSVLNRSKCSILVSSTPTKPTGLVMFTMACLAFLIYCSVSQPVIY